MGDRGDLDLESRVEPQLVAVRARWPTFRVDPARFVRFVAERLPVDQSLDALYLEDLYLTCACADGDAQAIAAFEGAHRTTIDTALAGMGELHGLGDEIRQRLRTKLLVSEEGARPRIASYSGRGDLRAWIRATTIREAYTLMRSRGKEVLGHDEMIAGLPVPDDDPEIAHLKQLYRAEFKAAFEQAFAKLDAKDRLLLRYRFVDGANIDDIAVIYRVHRATAARWLADVRGRLLADTRELMIATLKVSESEVDSIVRLIQSQLEASISGQLRAGTA